MIAKTIQTKGKWLTLEQKWQIVEQGRRVHPVPSLAELACWSEATS
ncbi:hypothetical protein PC129_g19838 [Phytophthora cactorum]|uniref:Uncharacterized protein n=1 Tax=Phytophthora cactorum TaxID=29920 RepID=A0A329RRJ3_9STRA|nr:hypothetical protein Pcac1_g14201 [Phytophthora cactorum]KAG2808509.1 hypothetical protein PC111_g16454 [Phytophthora cactorum]KAG2812093.1 hypothetical protein PC112_g15324 [Phytophthora cactorum]KAG2853023.1 hypothetical protein PC113_g14526 [Phytophthora cactorum]KAG2878825.1 hypothetical protein PC114_g22883 [Phytophthora cactorum]